MIDQTVLEEYLKMTGQDINEVHAAKSVYGYKETEDILKQAIEKKMMAEFYYETDEDIAINNLSFRFVTLHA